MRRSGISLDTDAVWRTKQLYEHLQKIVQAFPDNFQGTIPIKPVELVEITACFVFCYRCISVTSPILLRIICAYT